MFCIFICMYDDTYVEIQFNNSKPIKSISSWNMVKNTKTLYVVLFLNKTSKECKKTQQVMFCIFAIMMSLTLNSKFCKVITSWNLTKMSQNFVQDSFSINLTKICHKSKGKFWPQVQFKVFLNANRVFLNKFILRKHYIFCSLTTDSKAFMIQHLHPKRLEWGQLDKPLWFSHKCIF